MRALLSVYDKTGIVDFARGLLSLGFEIVSTGGTFRWLDAAGLSVTAVSDVTGFPEILDGRVKTLHPAIHGALLARRDDAVHREQIAAHGIVPIDLLAANLYPFQDTVAREGVTAAEAIEQIDIGGPAMIRAAAKSFASVTVVADPGAYPSILEELASGGVDPARRQALAADAFGHVAAYDAVVADYLRCRGDRSPFPDWIAIGGRKARTLRYGENPHQRAAAYHRMVAGRSEAGVLHAEQLGGKDLSFNNLLDADAAWRAVSGLGGPAVAIVKHAIPCGLAARDELGEAFAAALAGDPVSAFGGIVALNRSVDGGTARRLANVFFEVVVAPAFDDEARAILGTKRQLRLLQLAAGAGENGGPSPWDFRPIRGGLLVQEADDSVDDPSTWRVVTRRAPTESESADLRFAWWAVRQVTSNAIALSRDMALVGIGSGQPNRVDSVRIATTKAGTRSQGAVLASDAFFPFKDGIEAAAASGVTAVVQPGGSVRDDETVAAADEAGLAMLFTAVRHFRH